MVRVRGPGEEPWSTWGFGDLGVLSHPCISSLPYTLLWLP